MPNKEPSKQCSLKQQQGNRSKDSDYLTWPGWCSCFAKAESLGIKGDTGSTKVFLKDRQGEVVDCSEMTCTDWIKFLDSGTCQDVTLIQKRSWLVKFMQVLEGNVTHKEGARSVHLGVFALSLFWQINSILQWWIHLCKTANFLPTGTQKATVFARPVKYHNYTTNQAYNYLCHSAFPWKNGDVDMWL